MNKLSTKKTENFDNFSIQSLVYNTLDDWYDSKHRKITIDEIKFINSIPIVDCPYCHNTSYINYGYTKLKIRKYYCKECRGVFTPITGTMFDSKKIPMSEWIEYLLHLFEFHSIKTSAIDNRNAISTGNYWLKKVFLALKNYQDNIILSGNIYLDETFINVINKDIKKKGNLKYKGISTNKLCIGCATDRLHHIYFYEGKAKPTKESTFYTFHSHISPNSNLYHDYEKAHLYLFKTIPNLVSYEYKSIVNKYYEDKKNPLYPINHEHMLLKKFLSAHQGFDRRQIQDWLNLFSFIMNPPFNRFEKAIELIKLMINTRNVVRFKENKSKKIKKIPSLS